MNQKIAVITGGAGFIGSHLTDFLIDQNWQVRVVDNLSTGRQENINSKADFFKLSIMDNIDSIFRDADYVFHLAALPQVQFSIDEPQKSNSINAEGTLNVLEIARRNKIKKVIFSSSCAVYGDQEILPITETADIKPKSPYGLQKYVGELYCQLYSSVYNLPTICLRYFNVYGPRQSDVGAYSSVIANFLKQKKTNQPLTVVGKGQQTRDFVHVKDVVQANFKAVFCDVDTGDSINIGSGQGYSVNQIAGFIGGPIHNLPARIEPQNVWADNRKAIKVLNWQPTIDLKRGIKELIHRS